ncbi:MAG: 16S rRNA (uracil(1498)-N(3))-methyltransferase [Bacteroidales bacterium]|nr:MAG: 16S rRNA (uracil(1498)-N(3))-methyltransferase [Bacteroidales bacterium]
MQIFYAPDITGNLYTLSEEESKHCIRVLRLDVGNEITIVDGKGGLFKTRIVKPEPKRCMVEVYEAVYEFEKRNHYLHIAIAPTKNIERFEWFLEKATEIGIDEITPLLCEHSERKTVNNERLEKIIVSAMKQSIKAYLPKLNQMVSFKQFIEAKNDGELFIAHCYKKDLSHLKDEIKSNQKSTILIGPEGDFSPDEVSIAIQHNFKEISLGTSRLRTETAGVVACHIANLINF